MGGSKKENQEDSGKRVLKKERTGEQLLYSPRPFWDRKIIPLKREPSRRFSLEEGGVRRRIRPLCSRAKRRSKD